MLASLPEPTIDDKNIYACGVIAPVYNLVSGVTVKVFDKTAGGATIGTDSTPDDWGSNWDPVLTSALDAPPKTSPAHHIYAEQLACNGATSNPGPAVAVQTQPPTVNQPEVQSAIVGNNTVTLDKLLTGAIVQIFDHATPLNGPSAATGANNWFLLTNPLTASTEVMPEQKLCDASTGKKGWPTTNTIPPPELESPICPGQGAAFVLNSTVNAALVLLKGSTPEGYGGAATGSVQLDIAPPAAFGTGDNIRVAEYFTNPGSPSPVYSNTVTVGCKVHVRQDIASLTSAQIEFAEKRLSRNDETVPLESERSDRLHFPGKYSFDRGLERYVPNGRFLQSALGPVPALQQFVLPVAPHVPLLLREGFCVRHPATPT